MGFSCLSRYDGRFVGLLLPGLQIGNASNVAAVDKFSLVLVAVFAFGFLGEHHSMREWLGIALVASGVVCLAFKK